jgi:hypothetical protein
MTEYTLIGNSIARDIQPEEFKSTVSIPGASLHTLLKIAKETEGFKVILAGIPDICDKGCRDINPRKIIKFRENIKRLKEENIEGVLTTFYPPAYLSNRHFKSVDDLNERIIRSNRGKGESTPKIDEIIFRPSKGILKQDRLIDGVHPTARFDREIEDLLTKWKKRREEKQRYYREKQKEDERKRIKDEDRRKEDKLLHLELQREAIEEQIEIEKIKRKYKQMKDDEERKYKEKMKKLDREEEEMIKEMKKKRREAYTKTSVETEDHPAAEKEGQAGAVVAEEESHAGELDATEEGDGGDHQMDYSSDSLLHEINELEKQMH